MEVKRTKVRPARSILLVEEDGLFSIKIDDDGEILDHINEPVTSREKAEGQFHHIVRSWGIDLTPC